MKRKKVIAVVDPVSVGAMYGSEIRAMGYSPIAIFTQKDIDNYSLRSFKQEDYDAVFYYEDLERTIALIEKKGASAVIHATQSALELVDTISNHLHLVCNPIESMQARTNKTIMKQYLKQHQIPCANFYETGNISDLFKWVEKNGYPVVLKPNASSGSSNVFLCRAEEEVLDAFHAITHTPCVLGKRYNTVLAEEYLDGDEYFINLLHNGNGRGQLISAACYEKIQKNGHASIYRNIFSLSLDDEKISKVLPYVQDVNECLGVRYGINDTEFKMTSKGVRLIEVNNRLPGANTPYLIYRCSGLNCYQENVRIFLNEYKPVSEKNTFKKHYCVSCLINDKAGVVRDCRGSDEVKKLSSFDSMSILADKNVYYPKTTDLVSTWGLVFLVHEDREQLKKDAEFVHATMKLEIQP